ncbi:MAG: hypothetical protein K2N48_05980 [Muribaculaceae bacterium]|nr:hypothetical protein [Muribaculaceae bacterium]
MKDLRIIGFSVLLLLLPLTINSQLIGSIQFDPSDFSMPDRVDGFQDTFEETLTPGIFIVKTGFQICNKESGELFGLNGKDEFGEIYGIGVKTTDGILLYDKSVRPWRYNQKFGKYMEKYDPIFTQPMYRTMSANSQLTSLEFDIATGITLVDSTLYKFDSPTFDKDGFKLNNDTGKLTGWIVWIIAKDTDNLGYEDKIDFNISRQEWDISDRGYVVDIEQPNTELQILGGIFLVPKVNGPGALQFSISGIAVPINEKWTLAFPDWCVQNEKEVKPHPQVEENNVDGIELTPINKEKGKSKPKKDDKKKKR